jgi:hypothetical protein
MHHLQLSNGIHVYILRKTSSTAFFLGFHQIQPFSHIIKAGLFSSVSIKAG